jgi:hypothetical protein
MHHEKELIMKLNPKMVLVDPSQRWKDWKVLGWEMLAKCGSFNKH